MRRTWGTFCLAAALTSCGGGTSSAPDGGGQQDAGDGGSNACANGTMTGASTRYRITRLSLEEPEFYLGCGPIILTGSWSALITAGLNKDDAYQIDEDSFFDLGMAMSFDATAQEGELGPADCTDEDTCSAIQSGVAMDWEVSGSNDCTIDSGSVSVAPCCFTGLATGTFQFSAAFTSGTQTVKATNVQIVAQFTDGADSEITNGTILGFISEEDADAGNLAFRGSECDPNDVVSGPGDVPGFDVVFSFTAEKITE